MKLFALADCNNFFVSCERVFNPTLAHTPVVVLSSNDGCIIARSNEAKKLGIQMGEPAFKCAKLLKAHNVAVFSSNFALYGDMSARVMQTLSSFASSMEIYSIDEAFLQFPQHSPLVERPEMASTYHTSYARLVRKKVHQHIGIPISIGIGPTKTLAKVANHIAKKDSAHDGVFDITQPAVQTEFLQKIDVQDIWGIGYRYAKFLRAHGVHTAFQLRECADAWIRKHLTIQGLKTVTELRAIPCLELQEIPEQRKSLTVSRSFGRNVTELTELKEAVAYHVSAAGEKLRAQELITSMLTVFVRTMAYHDTRRFYASHTVQLPVATAYTPELIAHAHRCLEKLFVPGTIYKKVGVLLTDFTPATSRQLHTFMPLPNNAQESALMNTLDEINTAMGRNTVFFGAAGITRTWQTKRAKKSSAYTTNWHELLTIKI